ncbi:MAG: DUF72 domain-containing protein, partial [Nitrospirae bacterium]
QEVYKAWERTRRVAEVLKAEIILFQTPSSFKPTDENIKNMERFFERIKEKSLTFVLELRNWPWDRCLSLAETIGIVPVITEENLDKEPPQKLWYIRLHGRKGYRYKYTDEDLKALAERIKTAERRTYVFFNNLSMYEDALKLKKMIE